MTSNAIPMIDLAAQHAELEDELVEALRSVVQSSRFIMGETVSSFEADLAKLCDVPHAVSCNSGTDALWLSLHALGVGPGDAVLCPAYSFFASAATIARLGARPVFADIDPTTFNMDCEDALRRAEAEPALRAIVTVDLFGRLCESEGLSAWAADRGIPIVEDAAQSISAADASGAKPGQRSRVACFSFYPTKNLGALGDAGGVVTTDAALAERIARLGMHGEVAPGVYESIGINSRLDALLAAALSVKLGHLEDWTRARRRLALHYDALFAERGAHPASMPLGAGTLPLQTPLATPAPGRHVYHRYVVRVPQDRRTGLIEALRAEGIASEVYYSRGLHQQPALKEFAPTPAQKPLLETERASRESLALPLYPELGLDEIERVVECVAGFLRA